MISCLTFLSIAAIITTETMSDPSLPKIKEVQMTIENSELSNKAISSIGGMDTANLFERVVSTKNGVETLRLSDLEIEAVTNDLLENKELVGLITSYREGLENPNSFSEEDEVSLRQSIFPIIDATMQEINPAFSIFSAGVLEVIFVEIGRQE